MDALASAPPAQGATRLSRHEHLVRTNGALDTGESEVQVAAAKELAGRLADDAPPGAVALLVTLAIGAFELGIVTLDKPVERRLPRLARAVDGCDLRRQADHGTAAFRFWAGKERKAHWNVTGYHTDAHFSCR